METTAKFRSQLQRCSSLPLGILHIIRFRSNASDLLFIDGRGEFGSNFTQIPTEMCLHFPKI